ncbi:MAG: hypothetical protein PHW13_10275 [Methylococcales bacterium]|nr:hypothetical protein [Methylococcales bacterium]
MLTLACGCAAGPDSLHGAAVFAECPVTAPANDAQANPAAACAEQVSIYGDAVWVPVFGPLYDAAVNESPDSEPGLTVLATLLPGIGPALQTGLGAKRCLTKCLPPAAAQADTTQTKAYFDLALDVSDDNCRHFLDTLDSGETATAATVGSLGQGRLEAVLIDTIRQNRRQARQILQQAKPTAAEVQSLIGAYDGLCSLEHALATLEDATRNQLSGSFTSDKAEQKTWLTKSGITAQNTESDGKPKDKIRHINNILKSTTPRLPTPTHGGNPANKKHKNQKKHRAQ